MPLRLHRPAEPPAEKNTHNTFILKVSPSLRLTPPSGLPHLLAVLLGLADLLSHGVHLLQEGIHLLLFIPKLTGQALFGGAEVSHPLRQV